MSFEFLWSSSISNTGLYRTLLLPKIFTIIIGFVQVPLQNESTSCFWVEWYEGCVRQEEVSVDRKSWTGQACFDRTERVSLRILKPVIFYIMSVEF